MVLSAATVSSAPFLVLAPVFADAVFHRGSRGLGFLMAGMGVGAVIGTVGLARRTHVRGLPAVISYSALLLGAANLAFAVSPNYYVSLAFTLLIGYGLMRQLAAANTTIQTMIPDDYRGRIMSLYSMCVVGMGPFGSLGAGVIADHFGARLTMALGGLVSLISGAAFGWAIGRGRSAH